MSKMSRVAVIASLDGVRYVLVALLAAASLCFFLLAFLDSFHSVSFRDMWAVSYLLRLGSSAIEQLSSWLHAGWLLQLRRISALVIALSLWALGVFVNAALRAFTSRITRVFDLSEAEEVSSSTLPSSD